jgi:hypothetical protein
MQFSTGLTKSSGITCNTNTPPTTEPGGENMCISASSRTAKFGILKYVNDIDNNDVYLTGADFVNASDGARASLAINPTSDSVILTVNPGVDVSTDNVFEIIYYVKDNGSPASQCATGLLKVKTSLPPGYPDIRIRICPDAGIINLSKYIDTVNDVQSKSIQWTGAISGLISSPSGTVSSEDLKSARVYTFTYELSDLCGLSPKRKVYLERLTPDKMHPLKDTVVMCYKYAEAVQINQLFGIEARGKWEYLSSVADDVDQYVTESTSPEYEGAVVMNGKAIYESSIQTGSYHGNNNVKTVTFTYKADDDSCLHGKEFIVTIVLTDDIMY